MGRVEGLTILWCREEPLDPEEEARSSKEELIPEPRPPAFRGKGLSSQGAGIGQQQRQQARLLGAMAVRPEDKDDEPSEEELIDQRTIGGVALDEPIAKL